MPLYLRAQANSRCRAFSHNTRDLVAIDAFVRLVRANVAVTRELSAQLSADHGLNINAYEALLQLAKAPDSRMRRVDLANSLLLTAGGVTRLLDGLERDGLVAREECCDSDRRVSYAVLTKAGRDKLREASKSHTRQIRELMGGAVRRRRAGELAALLDGCRASTPAATAAASTPSGARPGRRSGRLRTGRCVPRAFARLATLVER